MRKRLRETRTPSKESDFTQVMHGRKLKTVHKQVLLWRKRRKRAADKLIKLKAELEQLKEDPMARVLKRKFFTDV